MRMIDFFDRGVRIAGGDPCIVTAAASKSYAAVDAASRRFARFLIEDGFPAGAGAEGAGAAGVASVFFSMAVVAPGVSRCCSTPLDFDGAEK